YTEDKYDAVFYEFQRVLNQNPNQSVRWRNDLEPLWISNKNLPLGTKLNDRLITKGKKIPNCEHCGAIRRAELQLLPTIIYQLKVNKYTSNTGDDGMDFGTIVLYTCSKHCELNGYAKEYLVVQPPV